MTPKNFATAPSGGDAEQLPFDNGAFDGAAELGRVCRSGGHLVRRVISTFGVMFAADSLETLLGFDEVAYLALFLWLAVAGPGLISADLWQDT
jgi:hypothetical protein